MPRAVQIFLPRRKNQREYVLDRRCINRLPRFILAEIFIPGIPCARAKREESLWFLSLIVDDSVPILHKDQRSRYSLFGRDYPVPAELLKVHRELVPATPGLVAGLVAVQPHVPLDPGGSSRVELLHLHLEVRGVLCPGIRLH